MCLLQLTLVRRLCRKEPIAYYRIANHYRFIMQQIFDCRQFDKLILVEDDMLFAPDFFAFFEATALVLEKVHSLHAEQNYFSLLAYVTPFPIRTRTSCRISYFCSHPPRMLLIGCC